MDDQSPYSITVDKSADGYVARLLDGKTEVRAVTRETPDLALTCVMSAIRQQLPAVPPRDAPRLRNPLIPGGQQSAKVDPVGRCVRVPVPDVVHRLIGQGEHVAGPHGARIPGLVRGR